MKKRGSVQYGIGWCKILLGHLNLLIWKHQPVKAGSRVSHNIFDLKIVVDQLVSSEPLFLRQDDQTSR